MYKVYTIENHKAKTHTIYNTNRHIKVVDRQKANFLAVKLVNWAKTQDLRINLTNIKVY